MFCMMATSRSSPEVGEGNADIDCFLERRKSELSNSKVDSILMGRFREGSGQSLFGVIAGDTHR